MSYDVESAFADVCSPQGVSGVENSELKHAYRVPSLVLPVYPRLSSHLHSQDAEDDEEGAADHHDVADGLQRRHQGLDHQLQPRGSADHAGTWHIMGY